MRQESSITGEFTPMSETEVQAKGPEGRRTERLLLKIPLRVICFGGSTGDFTEETYTIFVNRDGALIALKHAVASNETLRIINLENLREADFRVVGSARMEHGEVTEWGVECLDKHRTLWDIDFPPPLGTGSETAGALLECQACKKQALRVLTLTEVDVLETAGKLEQLCNSCGELTSWAYADVNRRPKEVPGSPEAVTAPQPVKWDGKKERRLHRRIALKLPVLIRNDQGRRELAKTEDISKGGFAVILDMVLSVGEVTTAVCPYTEGGQNIEQKSEVRRRVMLYAGEKWLYGFRYLNL
jgi:PilZ domain